MVGVWMLMGWSGGGLWWCWRFVGSGVGGFGSGVGVVSVGVGGWVTGDGLWDRRMC